MSLCRNSLARPQPRRLPALIRGEPLGVRRDRRQHTKRAPPVAARVEQRGSCERHARPIHGGSNAGERIGTRERTLSVRRDGHRSRGDEPVGKFWGNEGGKKVIEWDGDRVGGKGKTMTIRFEGTGVA